MEKKEKATTPQVVQPGDSKKFLDFTSFKVQSIFLLLITFLFYSNTLLNQFCLDDGLVWTDNQFVKKGFGGIFDIFFHDSFYGAIGNNYNLGGGRWRPLSLITFAIEHQLYGMTPWVSHLINVLLYGLTAIVLLHFLRKFVFSTKPWMAFVSVFLFVIHPVHTEVVANIKSRDEILSLLFLLLMLHFVLDYIKSNKGIGKLLFVMLFYFLALLSKENGIMFFFILPLTMWVFTNATLKKIILMSLPFYGVAMVYLAIRIGLIGFTHTEVKELMDNPYLLASTSQKFATIFVVFLIYFRLLFFPHPLTYDYSYNQVPYRDFGDGIVLFSVIIHVLLIAHAVYWIRKKDILSYCILFYFAGIFIVSNILINIGAPLGERFLYQPSIVFCIGLVVIGEKLFTKILKLNSSGIKWVTGILLFLIFIPAFAKTVSRNSIWSDKLGTTDVETSTHSAKANTYAALNYISISDVKKDSLLKRENLQKALHYFRKSFNIYPYFFTNYLNWGVAYSRLDSLEQAEWAWNEARRLNPYSSNLVSYDQYLSQKYYTRGLKAGTDKDFDEAVLYLRKAVHYNPENTDAWYNLGGVYYTIEKFDSARFSWNTALQLKPDYEDAQRGLNALQMQGK